MDALTKPDADHRRSPDRNGRSYALGMARFLALVAPGKGKQVCRPGLANLAHVPPEQPTEARHKWSGLLG